MGESAFVVHSFSYTTSISHESNEDNPIQALSQSIAFGRFMTESLDWGKWSTFSHKKYVEEAEKFSQPGSVAEKKAFFEAHYKRIAESKKAPADASNEHQTINDTQKKQQINEDDNTTCCRKSFQMEPKVSEKDSTFENSLLKPIVEDNHTHKDSDNIMGSDETKDNPKNNSSIGGESEIKNNKEDEARRSISKLSMEIKSPPRISDAGKKIYCSEKLSERIRDHNNNNNPKNKERAVRRRFGFLNCLMINAKARDQNATRKTNVRKQEKKPKKLSLCLCFKPNVVEA